MYVLALDTSTRRVTAAIGTEDGVLGAVALGGGASAGPPRHTETLVPAIDELLRATGIEPAALTAVGVGVGPGMFTGLRAGVVTATVFAAALGLPVAEISSLDAVAFPLFGAVREPIAAVLDARRAEVYYALYRSDGSRLTDDAVERPVVVASMLADRDEVVRLCGDAAPRVYDCVLDAFLLAGPEFDAPSPHALVELTRRAVARGELVAPAAVRPRYLRQSDAEINRDVRSERNPVVQGS